MKFNQSTYMAAHAERTVNINILFVSYTSLLNIMSISNNIDNVIKQ